MMFIHEFHQAGQHLPYAIALHIFSIFVVSVSEIRHLHVNFLIIQLILVSISLYNKFLIYILSFLSNYDQS